MHCHTNLHRYREYMAALEVARKIGRSGFFRACMVSLNRSLRLLRPMLREDSSLTPSPKHIFRRYHKIRKDVKLGDIKFCKVHTVLNGSDLLTKTVSTSNA